MRQLLRRPLIVGAALALAGCGTVTATSSPGSHAARATVVARPSPVSQPSARQQRAEADAASILAAFVPPPGARRLAGPPDGAGTELDQAEYTSEDPDFVDDASLWAVPGKSPLQVLAWEKAHLPVRFQLTLTSGEAIPGPRPRLPGGSTVPADPYHFAAYGFDLPALSDILISREMLVQVVRSLAGQTYVRVDAQVIWLPQRPASERVPRGVGAIKITAQPFLSSDPSTSGTVTDPAKVDKIIALLDGLDLAPNEGNDCAPEAVTVALSFLGHIGGPVLATADTGCQQVQFAIRGKNQPALWNDYSFAREVAAIAGIRWPAPKSN